MNLQPPRLPVNGQLVDQERRGQLESKMQFGKSHSTPMFGTKAVVTESSSRDRLIYISACLIGLNVEVHVKNGSIYSGIFHSANTEKDFGVVLKMAQIVRDGSQKEQKQISAAAKRPQTVIITSRELVQIIAKDMPLTGEEFSNGNVREKRHDLLIDSAISRSNFMEERELERWIPDDDDPQCQGLEDILDGTHYRKWDQFETNEVLFGVKSTFSEELYTTKLERGPQTRELEKEALRIAREIEGEDTHDLHLAEERGIDLDEEFDLDDESRYSAVDRGAGCAPLNWHENIQVGFHSEESFGQMDGLDRKESSDISERKSCNTQPALASCSQMDETHSHNFMKMPAHGSSYFNQDRQLGRESVLVDGRSPTDESRFLEPGIQTSDGENNFDEQMNKTVLNEIPVSAGIQTSSICLQPQSDRESVPSAAVAPSFVLESKESAESTSSVGLPVSAPPVTSNSSPGSSRSSSSEHVGSSSASSGPGMSPSSSLTSEKPKLNPYAKEFKLNPNAKSFTPSLSMRPQSPASEGSFYYPTNVSTVPQAPGLPVGVGIGPPYGMSQPIVYNPQAVQMQPPQPYMHPGGPYGQQMYFAQPRPVLYMQSYPPEMPYKGRDF